MHLSFELNGGQFDMRSRAHVTGHDIVIRWSLDYPYHLAGVWKLMILFRKKVFGELKKTFDTNGTLLLQQFVSDDRAGEVTSINTDTLVEEEISHNQPDTDDSEFHDDDDINFVDAEGLQFDPDLAEFGTGDLRQSKTYSLRAMVVVHQLFDQHGKALGQRLAGHKNEAFGSVEEMKEGRLVSTDIEPDDEMPFPAIPLPFPYVWEAQFAQPEELSDDEKVLVKKFL